jgi:two-component system, OmpR family, phosphate regulon sensor histidine kinase PhoR
LLAMLPVVLSAAAIAALWNEDLRRFRAALQGEEGAGAAPRLPGVAVLTREARRRIGAVAGQLAAAEDRLRRERAILDGIPDPILVLDGQLRLSRANLAARRDVGADVTAILRNPDMRAALDRALAGAGPQTLDIAIPVPVSRQLHATAARLEGVGDDGILLSLADRTREGAIERMRADFVANASHELRTPLASLTGFIETLRGPAADDPEAQQRFLAIMAEQAARMRRLIDALLHLYRVELIEHQRPTGQVSLPDLAARVAQELEPALGKRRATLSLDIDPDIGPVTGDPDQLHQVLLNLVDNALRYGPEDVTIRIAVGTPESAGWPPGAGVLLRVADTGPGIAPEHLPRLTERFYRVDPGRPGVAGGTGLGLAIVKHIVSRHRGQLRIESVVGKGTTFSIWLPRA